MTRAADVHYTIPAAEDWVPCDAVNYDDGSLRTTTTPAMVTCPLCALAMVRLWLSRAKQLGAIIPACN